MRNVIITLLFSAISLLSFAQTPFTEKTLQSISQRIVADFSKVLHEETSPDYTFIDGIGGMYNLEQMKKRFANGNKIAAWDLSDVKIKQIGNVAFVTGINKHNVYIASINKAMPYNERFTYTYEYRNNKWLALAAQHSEIVSNNDDKPENTVKQWVAEYNKNSRAFFMDKFTEDCVNVNTEINKTNFFGKDWARGLPDGWTSNGEIAEMRSFQGGNLAVVMGKMDWHHKQTDGKDNIEKVFATFIMQKQGGKWMWAGYHSSPLIEEKPKDVVKQFVTEYNRENTAFFMDRCPESFRYTDGEGKFSGFDALKSDKTHTSDSEVSDLKSFQSGNLAVVSGIHTWKDATMKVVRKVAFTYTMQNKMVSGFLRLRIIHL